MNEAINAMQFEAIYCRLVDILYDVMAKFVMQAVEAMNPSDPRLRSLLTTNVWTIIDKAPDPKERAVHEVAKTTAYKLERLRRTARSLSFPVTEQIEILVLLRNCMVHREGKLDDPLRQRTNQPSRTKVRGVIHNRGPLRGVHPIVNRTAHTHICLSLFHFLRLGARESLEIQAGPDRVLAEGRDLAVIRDALDSGRLRSIRVTPERYAITKVGSYVLVLRVIGA